MVQRHLSEQPLPVHCGLEPEWLLFFEQATLNHQCIASTINRRLCERVLFSRSPAEAPISDPQQWSQEKALLFKYTSILSGSIARQQASLGRRLSKLEQRQLESEMATGVDGREDGGATGAALSPLHAQLRLLQEPWVRAAAVVGAICLPCQEPWVTRTLRVVCVALVARTSA